MASEALSIGEIGDRARKYLAVTLADQVTASSKRCGASSREGGTVSGALGSMAPSWDHREFWASWGLHAVLRHAEKGFLRGVDLAHAAACWMTSEGGLRARVGARATAWRAPLQ
jgi:hypothetical protein